MRTKKEHRFNIQLHQIDVLDMCKREGIYNLASDGDRELLDDMCHDQLSPEEVLGVAYHIVNVTSGDRLERYGLDPEDVITHMLLELVTVSISTTFVTCGS